MVVVRHRLEQALGELLRAHAAGAVGVELGIERVRPFFGAAGFGDRLLELGLRDRAVAIEVDLGE